MRVPRGTGTVPGKQPPIRVAHGNPAGRLPLFLEVGVLQGLVGSDSLIGIIGHHCVQEGEALRGQTGCQ